MLNNPVVVTLTRQLFAPVNSIYYGAAYIELEAYGERPGVSLVAQNDHARASFQVPWDFSTMVEASWVVIPRATKAAANWDIYVSFGANGEAYNTHTDNDTSTTYNVTSDQVYKVDISSLLAGIAAGDNVGSRLSVQTNGDNVFPVGILFRYN